MAKRIPQSKWAEAEIEGRWKILRLTPEEAESYGRLPKNHGPVIRIYRINREAFTWMKAK